MTFLENYLKFCQGNECPDSYHTFSCLTVLSALTGRKIWADQGYFKCYGNLYTILVGPPGIAKSTGADISIQLMDDIGGVNYSSECVSPRKLLEEMAANQSCFEVNGEAHQHAPLVAVPTELSNFISQDAPRMIDTLTALWSRNKHRYGTAHKGQVEIFGPSLTLLTCTTPEWITNNLRNDVISGGFSRRALWVYEGSRDMNKIIPRPVVTPAMKLAWAELVAHGRKVQQVSGPFEWEPGCTEFFDEWYVSHKKCGDEYLLGYKDTKPSLILTLAMLLSMADKLEKVLRIKYLKLALDYLATIEPRFQRVFEGIGRNELNSAANSIMVILDKIHDKTLPDSTLRSQAFRFVNSKEYEEIMAHLVRTDGVARVSLNGHICYKLLPPKQKPASKQGENGLESK